MAASHFKKFYIIIDVFVVFDFLQPFLKDPKDDMVLEAAVASGCTHIVTFNAKDFSGAEQFGVRIVSPQTFLAEIGEKP